MASPDGSGPTEVSPGRRAGALVEEGASGRDRGSEGIAPRHELTVAIASAGAEQLLVNTLKSLACQTDVECEILVIDDGLIESAALSEVAKADRRIRVYRNEKPIGEVRSLQRAIEIAAGSAMTFVEPGDELLPGALRAMLDALTDVSGVAMAHAYWVPRHLLSRISVPAMRAHRAALFERLPPGFDHRQARVVIGNVVQALPTFRRAVLRAGGGLVGKSLDQALHAAALKAMQHGEARIVPRLLCIPASTPSSGWRLRGHSTPIGSVLEFLGTMRPARMRRSAKGWAVWARSAPGWRALLHVRRPYEIFGAVVPRWIFPALRQRRPQSRTPRVAYVLWQYPALSETFIRREVQALRELGLQIEVVARGPDEPPLPADATSPAGAVTYYGSRQDDESRAFLKKCLRQNPWMVARLWLWLVRHHYHPEKRWWRDRNTLFDAAHLALALRRLGVTHVHSPWADQTATLSLMAARLLGLTFSVQARASEIHKTTEPPAALERLRAATFAITNSRYNEKYLRTLMAGSTAPPLSVIYGGVELHRFRPDEKQPRIDGAWRLVCVARLIEPKGLCHLLRVCRSLRNRGVDFNCEIIGGPEHPGYAAAWVELRKLHTELELDACVHFRGAQSFSIVLHALRNADVFVLPCVHSRDGARDITPNSLFEAMAMALPVLSTPTGAIPEIVDNEVNGLLVPSGDEAALLTAIERLLADDELRRRLGQAARRKIEEHFDIARNVGQRIMLFRSVSD